MSRVTEVFSATRQSFFSQHKEKTLKGEFEQVALPHISHLYIAAFYLTKHEAEAEDLVQETYLRGFRFFHKFESGTNCKAWLLTILRNLFINRCRQKTREPEMVDWEKVDRSYESVERGAESYGANPESVVFSKVMTHRIETALRKLPEEFRTSIILVDIDELTYEEAGKVMGCPVGTVRSRISRGRRILQIALQGCAVQSEVLKE